MENIASPTPGIESMAHCPGRVFKSFLRPPAPPTRKCLYVWRIHADICHDANLWNQQSLAHLAHFASPPSVFVTFAMFIEIGHLATQLPHPTQLNRPSLFSRIIDKLMHKPLPETLYLRQARLSVQPFCVKLGIHAGIPAAETDRFHAPVSKSRIS